MNNNIKQLWSYMAGNRNKYLLAIISIGLAVIFNYFSPLVVRFSVDYLLGGDETGIPFFLKGIVRQIAEGNNAYKLVIISAIAYIVIKGLYGVFSYFKGKLAAQASESCAKNLRDKLFYHIERLPYKYHVKAETGDLIQRCTSDVNKIRRFLSIQLTELGRAVFMISIGLFVMLMLNVKMTLIALSIVPIIFLFTLFFFKEVQREFTKTDQSEGKMQNTLQENLSGMRVVRAFAQQQEEINKFEIRNKDFQQKGLRVINLMALYWSVSDFLCMFQIGLVLVIGSIFTINGEMSLGTLIAFTMYMNQFLWPVRQLGRILTDMGKALVAVSRIEEIFENEIEDIDEEGLRPDIKGNISIENLYFKYENSKEILKGISLEIKKGETVAFLGATGSGKSSLVNLLPRLYNYDSGSIKIDGYELSDINKKWIRNNIGIVLQDPYLYSRSIKENIGMTELSDLKIYDAAKIACIHDVIEEFEDGYKTRVGENGVTLSGGQKQRLAIARMLIKDYPILVFDDSLSAVDTETDLSIRNALKERNKDTTTLIVSHRITTLSSADKIFVIDDGKIIDHGTHSELISREGLYKRIWDIQQNIENNSDISKSA